MMPILYGKLFHTGYAVKDMDRATDTLGRKFGIKNWSIMRLPEDSPGRALGFARAGELIIELIDIKPGQVPIYNDWIPEEEDALQLHHFGHFAENEEEWQAVARHFEGHGIPMVVDQEMGDLLCYRYWDTVALLGHYCEFVLMKPGGAGFWESVPSN